MEYRRTKNGVMLVSFTLQDKSLDTLKGNRERVFLPVSDAYHVFSLSFYLMGPDLCVFFRQKKKTIRTPHLCVSS